MKDCRAAMFCMSANDIAPLISNRKGYVQMIRGLGLRYVENAELPLVTTVINMIPVMGWLRSLTKKVCRGERDY